MFFSTCPDLCVVAEAGNGSETIERCLETRPAVVIMDMVMPAMDGPAVTVRIREVCPESKVVALSSSADPQMVTQALAAGAYKQERRRPGGGPPVIRMAALSEVPIEVKTATSQQ